MSEKVDVDRKPDPRAVLKILSPEMQKLVYEYLNGANGVRGHTYLNTVIWLGEVHKIEVSVDQLGDFRKWYRAGLKVEETFERCLAETNKIVEVGKREGWIKTAEEARMVAPAFFNQFVLNKRDPKLWALVEKVSLARDKVDIDKQKLGIALEDHAAATKAAQPEEKSKLTPEEKRQRFKEIMGIA
jgi:hypothetical protein